ncbi:hypothetical protein BH23CHL2_BH23CHL2_24690 [soil metagenome]
MADTAAIYKADQRLTKLLREAAKTDRPLRVETDGETYELRVHRKGGPLRRVEDYDPERAREALRKSFGILSDLDADAFIAEMKANRE